MIFSMPNQSEDHYTKDERDQRLSKILRGAFSGPPTPLKDIPVSQGKRSGQQRRGKDGPLANQKVTTSK
jgi:hypothetical protein